MNTNLISESVITCPVCGHLKLETMPVDACQFFYECENCKNKFKTNIIQNKKMIAAMFASLLIMVVCFTTSYSFAQTQTDASMMRDCCMMKDG